MALLAQRRIQDLSVGVFGATEPPVMSTEMTNEVYNLDIYVMVLYVLHLLYYST